MSASAVTPLIAAQPKQDGRTSGSVTVVQQPAIVTAAATSAPIVASMPAATGYATLKPTYLPQPGRMVTYTAAPSAPSRPATLVMPAPAVTHPPVPTHPPATLVLVAGARVVYLSKSTGQKFAGSVAERTSTGWLIKLDVDGGLKEVPDSEMFRVELESAAEPPAHMPAIAEEPGKSKAAAPVVGTAPVKSKKKSAKKSTKGCC
eukprot:TRINITY_DN9_c0_g1_i1.p1 TRINITY_DN9_c0_g1~~TRINITY_DN9_c0_g1_i1.p1  ORF type:complete len:220 (-),score=40.60 TRINITY_DN9_c0_g1_i1:91-702(-)